MFAIAALQSVKSQAANLDKKYTTITNSLVEKPGDHELAGIIDKQDQSFRAEKRSAQASAHLLSQAQGGLFYVLTVFVCCWSSE